MQTYILQIFLICLFAFSSFSVTSPVCFSQSTEALTPQSLYDQGKYQQALAALLENGLQTPADFYNAGNCYFRLGKFGQALSHYKKARSLASEYSISASQYRDLLYNLKLTENTLEKSGAIPKDSSIWRGWIVPLAQSIPIEALQLLFSLVTLMFAFLVFRLRQKKQLRDLSLRQLFPDLIRQPSFLVGFGVWILLTTTIAAVMKAQDVQLAAVVADLSVARSGPSPGFTELFRIPAGTVVESTGESREGWQQIRFSSNNIGWIAEKDLLPL